MELSDSSDSSEKNSQLENLTHGGQLPYPTHEGPLNSHPFDLHAPDESIEEQIDEKVHHLSIDEAKDYIRETIHKYETDPNFDQGLLERGRVFLTMEDYGSEEAEQLAEEVRTELLLSQDSPYIQVRAVVSNHDDPSIPQNTFRVWFLGFLIATIGTAINTYFTNRTPSIELTVSCFQVLGYIAGKFCEWVLPRRKFRTFGKEWSFNPGRFNEKEHMLLTIIANVSTSSLYSITIFLVQRLPRFFNRPQDVTAGYMILISLTIQLLGYSIAGLSRRFLVYPPSMIWPANLSEIALNKSFHQDTNPVANGWRISRLKFFTIVFFVYGAYYVFPFAIFQALSNFNWMVWIANDNRKYATVVGSNQGGSGLGLTIFNTLDWSWFLGDASGSDPLITPLFSTLNQITGALVSFVIQVSLVFSNTWYMGYIPAHSTRLYDRFGNVYNTSRIVNGNDLTLDVDEYLSYSPAYQSAGSATSFIMYFSAYTSVIVFVALHYGSTIWATFKDALRGRSGLYSYNDIHCRLMRNYKEVPEWWYGILFVVAFALGIAGNEVYHTGLPVWTLVFVLVLGLVLLLPVGVTFAAANLRISLNVFGELLSGYMLPNRALALLLFKSLALYANENALYFAQDLKLGHYMKIAPRLQFWAQLLGTIWSAFVSIGVFQYQLTNLVPDMCDPQQPDRFRCVGTSVFFNSAVQFGVIGPQRLYSIGQRYSYILIAFIIGAVIPIPIWYLTVRYPRSWWKYVYVPILLFGGVNDGSSLQGMLPMLWPALFFQGYIFRYYQAWWVKYNYILATALRSSIGIFAFFWFFVIQYHQFAPKWWGNSIVDAGCEGNPCTVYDIPGEYFGPGPGEYT